MVLSSFSAEIPGESGEFLDKKVPEDERVRKPRGVTDHVPVQRTRVGEQGDLRNGLDEEHLAYCVSRSYCASRGIKRIGWCSRDCDFSETTNSCPTEATLAAPKPTEETQRQRRKETETPERYGDTMAQKR